MSRTISRYQPTSNRPSPPGNMNRTKATHVNKMATETKGPRLPTSPHHPSKLNVRINPRKNRFRHPRPKCRRINRTRRIFRVYWTTRWTKWRNFFNTITKISNRKAAIAAKKRRTSICSWRRWEKAGDTRFKRNTNTSRGWHQLESSYRQCKWFCYSLSILPISTYEDKRSSGTLIAHRSLTDRVLNVDLIIINFSLTIIRWTVVIISPASYWWQDAD